MKTEGWFFFVIVLLILLVGVFVIVSRVPLRIGTGNVVQERFTCPDGNTVESEDDCPSVDFVKNVGSVPALVNIEVEVGDYSSENFTLTNSNDFGVTVRCGFDPIPQFEPESRCFSYYNGSFIGSTGNLTLAPGQNRTYTITAYTLENARLKVDSEEVRFTTHKGVYQREIVLDIWNSDEEAEELKIPLRIEVIE